MNNEENLHGANDKELTLPPVYRMSSPSLISSSVVPSIGRLTEKTFNMCEKSCATTTIENTVDEGSPGFQAGVNSIGVPFIKRFKNNSVDESNSKPWKQTNLLSSDFREASGIKNSVDPEINLKENQEDDCTKKSLQDCLQVEGENSDSNVKENFPSKNKKQIVKSKKKSKRNLRNDFFSRSSTKSVKIFKKSNNQNQRKNTKLQGVGFKKHQDKEIKKVLKPPGSSTRFQHFNVKIMDKFLNPAIHNIHCINFEDKSSRTVFKRRIPNENRCDVSNNVGKYSVVKNSNKSENTEVVSTKNYSPLIDSGNFNAELDCKTYPKFIESVLRKDDITKIVCNEDLETNYIIGKPTLDLKLLTVENLTKVLGGRKYLKPVVKVNKLKDEIYRNLNTYKAGIIYLVPDNNTLCDGTNSDDQLSETEEDKNVSREEILDILGVKGLAVNIIGCDEEENDNDKVPTKRYVSEEGIENIATTTDMGSSYFEDMLLSQIGIDDSCESNIDKRSISSSSEDEADENQCDIFKNKADIILNSLKSAADAKDVQSFKDILKMELKDLFKDLHFQEKNYFSSRYDVTKGKSIYSKRKRKLISEKKQIFSAKDEKFFSNLKKKNHWCAVCYKKANFYCCYSTFYCSYECQTRDWEKHYSHCSHYSSGSNDPVISSNPKYKELLEANSSKDPVYIKDLIEVQPTHIESQANNFQIINGPNDQRNDQLLIGSSSEQQPVSNEVTHQNIIHSDERLNNNEIREVEKFKSPIKVEREQLIVDHSVNNEINVLNIKKMDKITQKEVEHQNNFNYEIIDLEKNEELVTNQPILIDKNTVDESIINVKEVSTNLINKRIIPQEIIDLENYGTTVTKVSEKLMTVPTNRKDKPASCKEFLEAFPQEISSIEENGCAVPELVPLPHSIQVQTKVLKNDYSLTVLRPKSIKEHLELFSNEIREEYMNLSEENATPKEINSANENYLLPGLEVLQNHPHLQAKVEKVDNRNKIVICIPESSGKHLNNFTSSPNISSQCHSLVNNNIDCKTVLKNSIWHHHTDEEKKSKMSVNHSSDRFLDSKISERVDELNENRDEKNDIFIPSISPNVSIIRKCNKDNQDSTAQNNYKFSSSTKIVNRTVPSKLGSPNSNKIFLLKQNLKKYTRLPKNKLVNSKNINSPPPTVKLFAEKQ